MAQNQIQSLNHTHEGIINWLLANPGRGLQECAREMNITQAWLSTVVHSDVFQEQYRQRRELVNALIATDIGSKLEVAADIALSKLQSKLEKVEDPEFLLDATDKLLKRMGYGAGGRTAININAPATSQVVSVSVLQDARARIRESLSTPPEEKDITDVIEMPPESDL